MTKVIEEQPPLHKKFKIKFKFRDMFDLFALEQFNALEEDNHLLTQLRKIRNCSNNGKLISPPSPEDEFTRNPPAAQRLLTSDVRNVFLAFNPRRKSSTILDKNRKSLLSLC